MKFGGAVSHAPDSDVTTQALRLNPSCLDALLHDVLREDSTKVRVRWCDIVMRDGDALEKEKDREAEVRQT